MSDLILYSVRLLGMAAIVVVAVLIIKTKCGKFNRILLTLLFAGIFSTGLIYGSTPSIDENYRLNLYPLYVVPMMFTLPVSWLFMMLSRSFFKERTSVPLWAAALLALQFILDVAGHYHRLDPDCWDYGICSGGASELDLNIVVFTVIPTIIALAFNGLAIFWAVQDWRTDLVEQRRQFRRVITILFGLLGIVMISLEDISATFYPSLSPLIIDIDSFLLAAIFIVLSLVLLCADPARFVEQILARQPPPHALQGGKSLVGHGVGESVGQKVNGSAGHNASESVSLDLAQLLALIEEGCYRERGLNIARLASKMCLSEYQVRNLINKQLNFRNFNTFLNHHRIVDACQRLADPSKRDVRILDIALNVGFGSITSFNDAFKKQLNMNPTMYRKENLG